MTELKLQKLAKAWQKRLRLADWDVRVRVSRHWDMGDNRAGEVTTVTKKKQANISILSPLDWNESWGAQDQELTLVHELVHLHFMALEHQARDWNQLLEEQAVDALSKALVGRGWR